jgi:DNA-binding transcriptional MocR family regulator
MTDYRTIADAIASDISSGALKIGDRLPPQREFAYQRGIAVSTASRVYSELVRRGLVSGEVGRGTFVSGPPQPLGVPLYEMNQDRIDLELNYSVLPEVAAMVAPAMEALLDPQVLAGALLPSVIGGSEAIRADSAAVMAYDGWTPDPASIAISGNGRQAIAAALSALVPAGERVGIERMTYPVAKVKMARLGLRSVPLAIDEHGVIPEAIEEAQRAGPLKAVYLQPTLHNPLGLTMPEKRRAEIAAVLERHGIFAIEDRIYAFLHESAPAPLATHAPDNTIVVDSLSKRVAPGLTLGFLSTPPALRNAVDLALRSGGWRPQTYGILAAGRIMASGLVERLVEMRRRDAAARQALARERLAGFDLRGDPRAYHIWLELPEGWRADTFVAAASRRGVAVMPAASFAVGPGHAPNAVRLALASPPMEVLAQAFDILATVARSEPDENIVE